jgi:class 3 adenylate cyclase
MSDPLQHPSLRSGQAPHPSPLPRGEGRKALPTGTVTFLFTDIQGSTPLWESASEKMAEALEG